MFIDRLVIEVQGGKGGDGAINFLRETCTPRGGPDGGDGGDGGSVILRVAPARTTLQDVGERRHYRATPGENGRHRNQAGKNGEDCVILVPPGTIVIDEATGQTVIDLTTPGEEFVIAQGGRGGKGNARFATSINQVPLIAQRGLHGAKGKYRFELKLIAEAGLVGLPNAGKSTFLRRVTRATPRVAAYPFTTLHPHLGVTNVLGMGRELVLADIPGLIEGASEGKGLGDDFLRHVERTQVLVHLVDGAGPEAGGPDPIEAYRTIRGELAAYRHADLSTKPELVCLNKIDALDPAEAQARADALSRAIDKPVRLVSGVSGAGTRELLEELSALLAELKVKLSAVAIPIAADLLGTDGPP